MVDFKFEVKKILRGRKLLLALILSMGISGIFFLGNYINQYKIGNRLVDDYYPWYEKLMSERESFRHRMDEKDIGKVEQKAYLEPNEKLQLQLLDLFDLATRGQMEEVPSKLLEIYDEYEAYSEKAVKKTLSISETKLRADRDYYGFLLENGLPYEDLEYSLRGSNFARSLVDKIYGLPLALMILVLSVDIFTLESENGNEKIRKIQPVKRSYLFYSKFFAALIYSLIFIFMTLISVYLLAGIFGSGFGTFSYPVARGPQILTASKDGLVLFDLMSTGKYIITSSLYFAIYMGFSLSLVCLLATIFKDGLLVSLASILILPLGNGLTSGLIENRQWTLGQMPKYPIGNPLSFGFPGKILGDLRLEPLRIIWVPILLSLILVYLAYKLSENSYIQTIFRGQRQRDGETSLRQYEGKKSSGRFVNLRFEMVKLFRKKEVYVVCIMISFLALVYGLSASRNYDRAYDERQDYYTWRMEKNLAMMEDYGRGNIYDEVKKIYESDKAYMEAYENGDRTRIASSLISLIYENQDQALGFMGYEGEGFSRETIEINVREMEEIIARDVDPPIPPNFEVKSTPFDRFRTTSDYLRYMDSSKRYQPSINYIYNGVFENGLNYLILLFLVVSLGIGFSLEGGRNQRIRLMNIQPRRSREIYLSKLGSQILVLFSLVILSVGILLGGLRILGRKSEPSYPAIYYENELDQDYNGEKLFRKNLPANMEADASDFEGNKFIGYSFRDMGHENLEMTVIFILVAMMGLVVAMLISLFVASRWAVSLATIVTFLIGFVLSKYILKGKSGLLPFIWLDGKSIASGDTSVVFNSGLINWYVAIPVLVIWMGAVTFLGIRKYKDKYGRD